MNTIKIDFDWKAAAKIYLMGIEDGTEEGKQSGRDGVMEMAENCDRLVKVGELLKDVTIQ